MESRAADSDEEVWEANLPEIVKREETPLSNMRSADDGLEASQSLPFAYCNTNIKGSAEIESLLFSQDSIGPWQWLKDVPLLDHLGKSVHKRGKFTKRTRSMGAPRNTIYAQPGDESHQVAVNTSSEFSARRPRRSTTAKKRDLTDRDGCGWEWLRQVV